MPKDLAVDITVTELSTEGDRLEVCMEFEGRIVCIGLSLEPVGFVTVAEGVDSNGVITVAEVVDKDDATADSWVVWGETTDPVAVPAGPAELTLAIELGREVSMTSVDCVRGSMTVTDEGETVAGCGVVEPLADDESMEEDPVDVDIISTVKDVDVVGDV